MKVELMQEWLGHEAGSVVEVRNEQFAAAMVDRGIAKEVKETRLKKPQGDKMTKETETK